MREHAPSNESSYRRITKSETPVFRLAEANAEQGERLVKHKHKPNLY
jgi:hypothetical protein